MPTVWTNRARRMLFVALTLVWCVGCDQATKSLATRFLKGAAPTLLLNDSVRLQYAENPGAFLGLGSNLPRSLQFWLLGVGVGVLLLGLLVYALRRQDLDRTTVLALALVCAGGLSNLADRLVLGVVRDFLHLGLGPLRTGIFNVADVAITSGALILLSRTLTRADHEEERA